MLILGILLGLLLGLLSGGRITNLAAIQLRWVGLLFAAVVVRFGTELLLNQGVEIVDALRLPLLALGFGLLLTGLWVNRSYPGLSLAFVGILSNAAVIIVNGGYMPIWATSLEAAGISEDQITSALHVVVPGSASDFLVNLLVLGDVIPIPFAQNVASLGDLFLTLGLAFFLFAGVVRVPSALEEHEEAAAREGLTGLATATRLSRTAGATTIAPETGLAPSLVETASLERSMVLGAKSAGLASPALAPLPGVFEREPELVELTGAGLAEPGTPTGSGERGVAASVSVPTTALPPIALPRPSPETMARVRRHPYVRLALNGSFSALWAGQVISVFGDRIHQVALAAVVLITTGSVLASALVFVAATLPNLLLSPIAGTLVDRWDHKDVLVVSDLLRAATVLLVPIAAVTNVLLVYPLVFLITTISLFFRPARIAILPQIVREDELLSANSAMWVGETLADIVGWPLAAVFVGSLGAAVPIAFWFDAATYVASAAMLSTIVVRKIDRPERRAARTDSDSVTDGGAASPAVERPVSSGFLGELKAGWTFLRGEPTLLANTIQAAVAQLSVGVLIALTPAFALTVFGNDPLGWLTVLGLIETNQAIGSLIGGFLVGLIGSRFAKGQMIIGGYAVFGFLLFLFALTGNVALVLVFSFGAGIANMVFLIPSQTLFQERTPPELMGRVVGFRFALVSGAMMFVMGAGGLLAEWVGVIAVIAVSGLVTMAAGLAGLLVPAVRDA
jgi:DHA3 family macrolide efflux protein-like MFS transporter